MSFQPATPKQLPDHAILDQFGKQTYLGNAFVVPVGLTIATLSETPLLLLQNPALTGSQTVGKALFLNLRRFSSASEQVLIKTYFASVVSSIATATVPINLRPANSNASIAQLYPNGQFSVSSNGTLISAVGCAADDYVIQDNLLLIILDPGQSVLLTLTAISNTSTLVNADVSWYEL